MDAETYARMPETLSLRQTEVAGRVLVTTLTDANALSARELDALYSRRWQVEVDLRSIKAQMGMDIVRAKSPEMVDKEIAVYLLAYNLVCALMARAAAATEVLARALSFKATLQLLLAFQHNLRLSAARSARTMTAHLLGAISMLICRFDPDASSRTRLNEGRKTMRYLLFHATSHVPRSCAHALRRLKVVPWGSGSIFFSLSNQATRKRTKATSANHPFPDPRARRIRLHRNLPSHNLRPLIPLQKNNRP